MQNKIIRSICLFRENPTQIDIDRLHELESILKARDFEIQTLRICTSNDDFENLEKEFGEKGIIFSIGTRDFGYAKTNFERFLQTKSASFHTDLANVEISMQHVDFLFELMTRNASRMFNFAYTFNNANSSPYFPSGNYEREGFTIGLQPTDLAENAKSLQEWFANMKTVWNEIVEIFKNDPEFLGIDSSIAPFERGRSSLVNFMKKLHGDFTSSVTTPDYTQITKFIKEENPRPIGLCGLMMACLEDFELTDEYEQGNFTIERNLFLSLHSGLGIDVYPIGINEPKERVLEIMKLVQALSNKYQKPLSIRFVSDGKAKIGDRTDFQNQYLTDVTIRKL